MTEFKSMDKISVIVPVYNISSYDLSCTVKSVLSQTYSNLELILVNDGSEPYCQRFINEIKKWDERIIVIHQNNGGVSSARNTGKKLATGKYITFIDAGDIVEKKYLLRLKEILEDSGADCAVCGCQFIKKIEDFKSVKDDIQSKLVTNLEALDDLCYMHYPYDCVEVTAVWGTLFKADQIKNIEFNKLMVIGEDFDFKFKVYNNLKKIVYINFAAYGYVFNESSAINQSFTYKHYKTFLQFCDLLESDCFNPKVWSGLQCRVVNMDILLLLRINSNTGDNQKYQKEIENHISKNRTAVLFNNKARLKVRLALLLTLMGYGVMRKIFNLIA